MGIIIDNVSPNVEKNRSHDINVEDIQHSLFLAFTMKTDVKKLAL